jgi:hypothetical protein
VCVYTNLDERPFYINGAHCVNVSQKPLWVLVDPSLYAKGVILKDMHLLLFPPWEILMEGCRQ